MVRLTQPIKLCTSSKLQSQRTTAPNKRQHDERSKSFEAQRFCSQKIGQREGSQKYCIILRNE